MSAVDVLAVLGECVPAYGNRISHDDIEQAGSAVAKSSADLRAISSELRSRKINHGRDESPTLIAWADRIDAALANIGAAP